MIIVISPAKSLDFETPARTNTFSNPRLLAESEQLIAQLRDLSPTDIQHLMKISPKLADLNFGRFLNFHTPFTVKNAKQAVLAFQGDVYQGLAAESFSTADFAFAQKHLRILSGLYGLLKPLDLIQPYRLEMGSRFENTRGKNLYAFWGELITDLVNEDAKKINSNILLNLASNEYFKSIQPKLLGPKVITPVFKDFKNGEHKIISFYAKKARGLMSAFVIQNQLTDVQSIKKFDTEGYYFSHEEKNNQWVFLRDGLES